MRKAIVYGYGVSGKGAEKLLKNKGYEVVIVDDATGIKKEEIMDKLAGYELMIKSPGISPENELVKNAEDAGIEVIDEIELAARYYNGKIIAVTGTNGKTTTTTKIKEILEAGGFKAVFAGNIGNSFAEIAISEEQYDFVVLEVSSYQLEKVKFFKPYIAMSINHTPDHMTRYATLEDYYSAKFNIFSNQDENDFAIINLDDEFTVENYKKKKIKAKKLFVSQSSCNEFEKVGKETYKRVINKIDESEKREILSAYFADGKLFYRGEEIGIGSKFALKGIHNIENILFIVTAAKIAGVSNEIIREFLYVSKGLEHRVEEFFAVGGVKFINDSKGTNIDATIKALDGYEDEIVLICGGKDKNLDLDSLCQKICERASLLFLMGETADKLEAACIAKGYSKDKIYNEKTLDGVLKKIKEVVSMEGRKIILFSPAASSFDQFKSFEHRGEVFKQKVGEYFGGSNEGC